MTPAAINPGVDAAPEESLPLPVSPTTAQFITLREAGSESWYTANAFHPVVPSETSGVTGDRVTTLPAWGAQ